MGIQAAAQNRLSMYLAALATILRMGSVAQAVLRAIGRGLSERIGIQVTLTAGVKLRLMMAQAVTMAAVAMEVAVMAAAAAALTPSMATLMETSASILMMASAVLTATHADSHGLLAQTMALIRQIVAAMKSSHLETSVRTLTISSVVITAPLASGLGPSVRLTVLQMLPVVAKLQKINQFLQVSLKSFPSTGMATSAETEMTSHCVTTLATVTSRGHTTTQIGGALLMPLADACPSNVLQKATHTATIFVRRVRMATAMVALLANGAGPLTTLKNGVVPKPCADANLSKLTSPMETAAQTYTTSSAMLTVTTASGHGAQALPSLTDAGVLSRRFAKSFSVQSAIQ